MYLLFAVGGIWAVVGCVLAFSPELLRDYLVTLSAWSVPQLHLIAFLSVVLGAALLYYGRLPSPLRSWFLVIGLVTLLKGLTVFLPMESVVRPYVGWWVQQSDLTFRVLGVVCALIGAAMCWAVVGQSGGGKRLLPQPK